MPRAPVGTVTVWKLAGSPPFQNQSRPPLPAPAPITNPSGWNATPQAVPWKLSFDLSTLAFPFAHSNTTTAGFPTPAKAFDTFVIPAQASFVPVASNLIARAQPMSARNPGSYLWSTFASRSRVLVPVFRSQSLTIPLRSHDASRVPSGWNATL